MKYLVFLVISIASTAVYGSRNYIPERAYEHRETISNELELYFPSIPTRNYVPSLIEHESCISLTHSRCWKSTSELKSSREQGVGLGQVTRAYNSSGTVRFDSLTNMRNRYRSELSEASWDSIKDRPDLQIRIIVLMLRDDYKSLYTIQNEIVRLQMTDAAYNGGIGGLTNERRACGLASNCNPQLWFNNVEKYCLKSRKILYGNRSACDINRHHVKDVFYSKLPKYKKYYFNEDSTYTGRPKVITPPRPPEWKLPTKLAEATESADNTPTITIKRSYSNTIYPIVEALLNVLRTLRE